MTPTPKELAALLRRAGRFRKADAKMHMSTIRRAEIANEAQEYFAAADALEAAPPTPEVGKLARRDLAMRICALAGHDDEGLSEEPCKACKAEALTFAMRVAASVGVQLLHTKAAPTLAEPSPTWKFRLGFASVAIVNNLTRLADANTPEERREARLYVADKALRAAFPELAPSTEN